jgi:hypothetical protein
VEENDYIVALMARANVSLVNRRSMKHTGGVSDRVGDCLDAPRRRTRLTDATLDRSQRLA